MLSCESMHPLRGPFAHLILIMIVAPMIIGGCQSRKPLAISQGMRLAFQLDKLNLMGHSWGAMLAMLYTLRYPSHVQSLIIADPGGASGMDLQQGFGNQKRRLTEGDKIALATLTRTDGFRNRSPAEFFNAVNTFLDKSGGS